MRTERMCGGWVNDLPTRNGQFRVFAYESVTDRETHVG